MKIRQHSTLAAISAAALGVVLLTGCGADDDDCRSTAPTVMFLGTDHYYHYGSPTGKVVPAAHVPKSAQKVSGYRPPSVKIAPPKVDMKKPSGGSVKPPSVPRPAPAPRPAAPRR